MEIVYVLTNPAMPNLVKIGWTTEVDANTRIAGLYGTGVPVPFKLEFACRVPNGAEVERGRHLAFGPHRINPRREFFKIDPEQAIAILRLLHTEDATKVVDAQPSPVDAESLAAGREMVNRRPNLNFEEMGIPMGSVLTSKHGPTTVTVVAPRRVTLDGEEMSLTAATRQVLQLEYSVAPGPHWLFEGRSIRDIYEETYSTDA